MSAVIIIFIVITITIKHYQFHVLENASIFTMLFILFPLSIKLKLATRDIIAYSFPFHFSSMLCISFGALHSGVLGEDWSCISKLLLEEEKELQIQNIEFFSGIFPRQRNFLMSFMLLYCIKGKNRKNIISDSLAYIFKYGKFNFVLVFVYPKQ